MFVGAGRLTVRPFERTMRMSLLTLATAIFHLAPLEPLTSGGAGGAGATSAGAGATSTAVESSGVALAASTSIDARLKGGPKLQGNVSFFCLFVNTNRVRQGTGRWEGRGKNAKAHRRMSPDLRSTSTSVYL